MKTKEELIAAYQNMFGSPTGAVFNGHVNEANDRARCLMEIVCPNLLNEVEEMEKTGNGIMAIFNSKPTTATMVYAMLVNAFVLEA